MIITSFVGLLGDKALAAQSLYFQMWMFILLLSLSTGIGNKIIIGPMLGATQ